MESSKKRKCSSPSSSEKAAEAGTADDKPTDRDWLEAGPNPELHLLGFHRPKWNPTRGDVVALYDNESIEHALKRAELCAKHGGVREAEQTLRKLALRAPNNHRVLQRCAEFEKSRGNTVAAEGYMSCLILLDPTNEQHIRNRKRILSDVDTLDDFLLFEIDGLFPNYKLLRPESADLFETSKKSFFERYIYNTLAIEGNRLSPDEVRAITQKEDDRSFRVCEGKENHHIEVHGMLDVLAHLRTKKYTVKDLAQFEVSDICTMHALLLAGDNARGKLRDQRVWLAGCPFEPVDCQSVPEQMEKLVAFLRNGVAQVRAGYAQNLSGIHPVELAALFHYFFVHIHPFLDGNGRMARLLVNIVLEAFDFPPVIVPYLNREPYMESLMFGNMGDVRQFVRLIVELAHQTLAKWIADKTPYPILPHDDPIANELEMLSET